MSGSQKRTRLWRALISLEGLAVGDAFGELFFSFSPAHYHTYFETRILPPELQSWKYTDDTQMALSLVETLRRFGAIKQDELMASFVAHYEPQRGYGASIHALLRTLRELESGEAAGEAESARKALWREMVAAQFSGQGSFGNGAAMRVAPLGAYFASDLRRVVAQARLSATVTHTHPEAIAGAIAIAVAAALAWRYRLSQQRPTRAEFIERILPFVPVSDVQSRLRRARDIAPNTSASAAAAMLGSGYRISAQDTVPYVLWCAGQFLDDYEEALWQTASGLGDVDTTCAMVGGIVVLYSGLEHVPEDWLARREPLPAWALR